MRLSSLQNYHLNHKSNKQDRIPNTEVERTPESCRCTFPRKKKKHTSLESFQVIISRNHIVDIWQRIQNQTKWSPALVTSNLDIYNHHCICFKEGLKKLEQYNTDQHYLSLWTHLLKRNRALRMNKWNM